MTKQQTPKDLLLCRVRTWCGVHIKTHDGIVLVYVKDRPIARFPSEETLEAVLCGSIQKQIAEDPECLPCGAWPADDNRCLLVDLTQPGGVEEAIRVLLNAYIRSQSPEAHDWWMREERLIEDPTCEKIAAIIEEFRQHIAKSEAG